MGMNYNVLSSSFPNVPSCSVISKRLQSVFVASPLTTFYLDSSIADSVQPISYKGSADCLCLSRDERNLAVTTNTALKFIDLNNGRELRNLPAHSLPVKAVCPRRNSIYSWISGSLDSSWVMWDTRCHPANVLSGRVNGPIRCLDVSPDDFMLAVGTDSALQLFDIRHRSPLKLFSASTTNLQFNPCQMLLASYGLDKVVRFWCLDQLECVSVSDAFEEDVRGLTFSTVGNPDNDFLLTATDTELRMLTWEPCDVLSAYTLPDDQQIVSVDLNDEVIDLLSFGRDKSLKLLSCSIEDILLSKQFLSLSSSSLSDDEEQPVIEMTGAAASTKSHPLNGRSSSAETSRGPRASRNVSSRSCSPVEKHGPKSDARTARPEDRGRASRPPLPPAASRFSKTRRIQPDKKAVTNDQTDIAGILASFSSTSEVFLRSSKKGEEEVLKCAHRIKRQGLASFVKDAATTFRGTGEEGFVDRCVVTSLTTSRKWDLNTVHDFLPKLIAMLQDKDSSFVAVDALKEIFANVLDRVKSCYSFSSYGVDVPAEERKEKAAHIIKLLVQLRDGREEYYKHMDQEEIYRLDALMPVLKQLKA